MNARQGNKIRLRRALKFSLGVENIQTPISPYPERQMFMEIHFQQIVNSRQALKDRLDEIEKFSKPKRETVELLKPKAIAEHGYIDHVTMRNIEELRLYAIESSNTHDLLRDIEHGIQCQNMEKIRQNLNDKIDRILNDKCDNAFIASCRPYFILLRSLGKG